jgi:hypothetical protein
MDDKDLISCDREYMPPILYKPVFSTGTLNCMNFQNVMFVM